MRYNSFSRRYFLTGIGASLALPFLPSVMPKAYAAGTSPLRFIQIMNAHGQYANEFYTSDTGLTQMAGGVYAKPLSAINGNFSPIIGSAFNNFKNKMSVLRGLSVMTNQTRHNSSVGSCASGTSSDNNEFSPPIFPYSTDTVLSESSKVYPVSAGIQRHVNFSPGTERYPNFSWNRINGQIQQMPSTRDTRALLTRFAPLTGNGSAPAAPAAQNQNASVVQGVYSDYKALRDSGRLSTVDKNQLEAYMALVSQIQVGMQASAPTCTSNPPSESEVDVDAITRNQINILVAAMACQLTNVGALALSIGYDPFHGYVHSDAFNPPAYQAKQIVLGQHVAYLLSKMDMINEGGGTLLDNSIVYWGNEYGENTTTASSDNAHSVANMPVLVAGGAAGKLQMGQYIDYRKTGGRPLNNLLISFFNAMGLSSKDYERDGVVGFGEYDASAASSYGFSAYLTSTERRNPLPFFYNGSSLG